MQQLPYDYARCTGEYRSGGNCPQMENCLRYMDVPNIDRLWFQHAHDPCDIYIPSEEKNDMGAQV